MIEKTLVFIFVSFSIVYWYQYIDDKRKNISRSKVEKMKFPVMVSLLVGITLSFKDINFGSNCTEQAIFTEQPTF